MLATVAQVLCAPLPTQPAPERVYPLRHAKSHAPLAHVGSAFGGAATHAVSVGA